MNRHVYAAVLGVCMALLGTSGATDAAVARTVTVKWAAHTQPVIGYQVFYGKGAERHQMRPLPVPQNINLNHPAVTYNVLRDLGALPGQRVCFRVKAYDRTTTSGFSPAVCTTV
jgi:hypothetical protein